MKVSVVLVCVCYSSFLFFQRTSSTMCPSACNTCMENIISCTNGGLTQVPNELNMETKKITLVGHTFTENMLMRANFSKFSKPTFFIEQLVIRRSNIERILYRTFYDLSGLDILDLSENRRLYIENGAFENLKLKHLNLDSVRNLTFATQAFHGLMVASLSMKSSHLSSLPYKLIEPLVSHLRNLFITDNQLKTISSQYEGLFRQLKVLELHGNPYVCSCDLLWLRRTLTWRQSYYPKDIRGFTENTNPICSAPQYLRDQYIHQIPEWDFNCQPPRLERVEIYFKNFNSAILRCSASIKATRAPITLFWRQLNPPETYRNPLPIPQNSNNNNNVAAISVSRKSSTDNFVCSAESSSGNASVNVNIKWPNINEFSSPPLSADPDSQWKPKILQENYFFKQQFTLLELLGSVIGTFIITMVLFVIIYKFYFYKTVRKKREQMKKSGYATYEIGLYSDSQTYDIPHYSSSDCRGKMIRPIFPVTGNHIYIGNNEHNKILTC